MSLCNTYLSNVARVNVSKNKCTGYMSLNNVLFHICDTLDLNIFGFNSCISAKRNLFYINPKLAAVSITSAATLFTDLKYKWCLRWASTIMCMYAKLYHTRIKLNNATPG